MTRSLAKRAASLLDNAAFLRPVVFLLLIACAGLALYSYSDYGAQDFRGDLSRYPYIDPARHLIAQEHYFPTIDPLRKRVMQMTADFEKTGRRATVYIEYLNTGANISINQDLSLFPASLIKLPVAIAAMKRVQDGDWDLMNELVLLEGDKDTASGDLEDLIGRNQVGTRFTIDELLRRQLAESDNTANAILLRNTGEKQLLDMVGALGLEDLVRPDDSITSKEYSRILRALYSASYLNRENSNYLLSLLDDSSWNQFFTRDLEGEVPFPHKYGEHITLRIFADAGIMYILDRPVLLIAVVEGDPAVPLEEDSVYAGQFLADLANVTYEFVTSQ